MTKRQQRKVIQYSVSEWPGPGDDNLPMPVACTHCGKLFMEGEKRAMFFPWGDEFRKLIRDGGRLCVDGEALCYECTKFWLTCLKSLGLQPRCFCDERDRRKWKMTLVTDKNNGTGGK